MDMNYYQTLIAVADDCPVRQSVVPIQRGDNLTIAVLQYGMIAGNPYTYTQEDVLFQTWLQRQDMPKDPSEAELAHLREGFFAKPQACLRSSPLPKQYGWGLLFDPKGRVALCPMESTEYKNILSRKSGRVKILKAMRSKRV